MKRLLLVAAFAGSSLFGQVSLGIRIGPHGRLEHDHRRDHDHNRDYDRH